MGKCLKHIGIYLSLMERVASSFATMRYPKSDPIPLNKVGQHNDGEDANTTLLVELNGYKHIAILDSGVGIAIATKSTWEQWGKTSLEKIKNKITIFKCPYIETHRIARESSSYHMWD